MWVCQWVLAMQKKSIRMVRHQELIEATIIATHARGFTAVTMADIAKVAESTAASITYYFGSKTKLLEATMRYMLRELGKITRAKQAAAQTPTDRLLAVIDANFDPALFTVERCSVWMQFWAAAPYSPELKRLHTINRHRVHSNLMSALRPLVDDPSERLTASTGLQAYLDGIWVAAAQSSGPLDAELAQLRARRLIALTVGDLEMSAPSL